MSPAARLFALGVCTLVCALAGCTSTPTTDSGLTNAGVDYSRYVIVTVRNESAPPPRAGASVRTYGGASRYSVGPAARHAVRAIAKAHGLRESASWPIGVLGVHCVVLELPQGANVEDAITRLRRDRRVESAQPLQSFATLGHAASADPYRKLQRNLDLMQADEAHRWSRGAGVRIGLIDTGVDAHHPDIADRIAGQQNLVGDGENASAESHGTAVAGVIAAIDDNDEGIVGVAPEAVLYALRACWPDPDDESRGTCSSFTLAKALATAIETRMQVVNLSLAGPADPLLTRIVEAGLKRGIVFVGATPPGNPLASFPTNISGVIAANASGARVAADATLFAPVLAPGREVLTLAPGGRYDFLSGSSLAAASISGAVALLLARDPTLRPQEAHTLLIRSMRPRVAISGGNSATVVDLCAAVSALADGAACPD